MVTLQQDLPNQYKTLFQPHKIVTYIPDLKPQYYSISTHMLLIHASMYICTCTHAQQTYFSQVIHNMNLQTQYTQYALTIACRSSTVYLCNELITGLPVLAPESTCNYR